MFWLKSCPRCSGDLYEDHDLHGSFVACLQCSHYLTAADEAILRDAAASTPPALPVFANALNASGSTGTESSTGLNGSEVSQFNEVRTAVPTI